MDSAPELNNRTAIVTGAAGSLGSELCLQAAAAGWNVVLLDKDRKGLERAYDRIGETAPGNAALYPMDLAGATPELVEALLDTVVETFEGLDAVIHCAAHFRALTPVEHIQPQDWLVHMQVNLNAAWLLSATALPLLRQSGDGKLIYLLENLEKTGGALWGAYGVSKHALKALVNMMSEECTSDTVEVRGVNPGPMRSAIRTRVYHSENPSEMPSPEPIAARILAFLQGEERWDDVFMDLTQRRNR